VDGSSADGGGRANGRGDGNRARARKNGSRRRNPAGRRRAESSYRRGGGRRRRESRGLGRRDRRRGGRRTEGDFGRGAGSTALRVWRLSAGETRGQHNRQRECGPTHGTPSFSELPPRAQGFSSEGARPPCAGVGRRRTSSDARGTRRAGSRAAQTTSCRTALPKAGTILVHAGCCGAAPSPRGAQSSRKSRALKPMR
jgi:hypothetical protein